MVEQFTEVQNNLVKRIAENNGFKDYTIEDHSKSTKGDNYVGQIIAMAIQNADRKLELIFKKAPPFEHFRKFFPVRELFLNEIHLYDRVFPAFATFQKENGLKNIFEGYPKYYGYCDEEYNECLVMDNLLKNGYKHWNRKIPMNSEHVSLVMAEYGKLHAVSFALKKKNPEFFEKLTKNLQYENLEWQRKSIIDCVKNAELMIKKAVQGNSTLEKAYQKVTSNSDRYYSEEIIGSKEHMVVTHGDCWCNNLLFKYENPNDIKKPTKLCLVDWQMSSCGSPVGDISYFFYASSPKEILYDYEKYLKIYYDSLSESLRQMSCDPEELFPYEVLKSYWKTYGRFGLGVASFATRNLYVDSKDAPQIDENTKTIEEFFDNYQGMENEEKVNERIVELFNFVIDNNFV